MKGALDQGWVPYEAQRHVWPESGRHILARFDDETIVVYQAYRASIARWAVEHQCFGGEFSYSRMSWIKPDFLWMMFRSGWGTKEGQEAVLAITLNRGFFDQLLREAVPSAFQSHRYSTQQEWKEALSNSEVRLQWDPDHGPGGEPLHRRAVQLGLRGETLRRYGTEAIVEIEDISTRVAEQREKAGTRELLRTPRERVYLPTCETARRAVGLDDPQTREEE